MVLAWLTMVTTVVHTDFLCNKGSYLTFQNHDIWNLSYPVTKTPSKILQKRHRNILSYSETVVLTSCLWAPDEGHPLCLVSVKISVFGIFVCVEFWWVHLSFIHFPNRKMDKSATAQPRLIFCGAGPLSLAINMHESCSALVLNGPDPCVYVCECVCLSILD